MPDSRGRPYVPTGECLFPRLPDEILYHILEYLAPAQGPNGRWRYGPCLPIPLVCRRWEHLFSSILYRNIGFRDTTVKQLDATLRQRPERGDAVRGVRILIDEPSDATCEMVAYILRCCKGLRKFMLGTFHWTGNIWIVLSAAKRAALTTLELAGGVLNGGPSLQMILKHFNLPTLKEVSLDNFGLGNGEEPGAASYHSSDTAHKDLKLLLSSASSCNVTTMVLTFPNTPAHVTRSFLQWPARLTSLTMNALIHDFARYTAEDIQGILDDHHHTLQHICLDMLPGGIRDLPDFSSLTSLESLQINWYNLFGVSPCSAASKLKAPQLRHLEISFSTEDHDMTSPRAFGPDKIGWFERFFDHMTPGTNKLETVFIEFEPEVNFWSPDGTNDETWPWSYIDQTVGIFAAHNVAMTYSEPTITKREWDQATEQGREKVPRWSFLASLKPTLRA